MERDSTADDERWMRRAIELAHTAATHGDVPIGAVLVVDDVEVAHGANERELTADPTAHAEVLALRRGAERLGSWRVGGTLYVTLEPCLMCSGALLLARVDRVVFGAFDPKAGAVGSLYNVLSDPRLNHEASVTWGVLADDCGALLSDFFRRARRQAGDNSG